MPMPLLSSSQGYGALPKALHWVAALLFAFQFLSGLIMTRMDEHGLALHLHQDDWYNWHKTIGLVALLVAIGRLWARRAGELPPWAPSLSAVERRVVHRAEQLLYIAMFVMPLSGFVFTMAGGYGVLLAGAIALPNPIGRWDLLATLAQITHVAAAILLVLALATHLGLVLWHTLVLRDGLLLRMLPTRR